MATTNEVSLFRSTESGREALPQSVVSDIRSICPGAVATDVSLAGISRWRVGGSADIIVRPSSIEETVALRRYLWHRGLPYVIVGATSNLLFSDEGLRAVCVQIGQALSHVDIQVEEVVAQAGTWVPGLARRVMLEGLSGAEHICGIPGTLGGLICMNGGSQRKGIGSSVVSVTSVSQSGYLVTRSRAECGFGYRQSIFQDADEIIASARLCFTPATDKLKVRREMLAILGSRRRKFPQKEPNCGSVFKSDPAMYGAFGPPGEVLEKGCLKGARRGGAEVSPVHANFIVNKGGAKADDVLQLVALMRNRVAEITGLWLEAEARLVTPWGRVVPLQEAIDESEALGKR